MKEKYADPHVRFVARQRRVIFFLFVLFLGCTYAFSFFFQKYQSNKQDRLSSHAVDARVALLVREGNWAQAYDLFTGTDAVSLYNRGVLLLGSGYLSSLQTGYEQQRISQQALSDAEQYFLMASSAPSDSILQSALDTQKKVLSTMKTAVGTTSCFAGYKDMFLSLEKSQKDVDSLTKLLEEERHLLDSRRQEVISIGGQECFSRLSGVIEQSSSQLPLFSQQFTTYRSSYARLFAPSLRDPFVCPELRFSEILSSFSGYEASFSLYIASHLATVDALQANDREVLQQICTKTQDDSFQNQNLDDTYSRLTRSLDRGSSKKQSDSRTNSGVSQGDPEYQDIQQQSLQPLFRDLHLQNTDFIRRIEQIMTERKYVPSRLLHRVFDQFLGDTGVFVK